MMELHRELLDFAKIWYIVWTDKYNLQMFKVKGSKVGIPVNGGPKCTMLNNTCPIHNGT